MMKQQIEKDFLDAYKSHEDERVSVLRMVKSAIQNAEIAQKGELDESAVTSVLKKEIKQRKDSIAAYKDAGREDAAAKEERELEIISLYLPQQLSEEELKKIVENTISELNASGKEDLGKVIGAVMKEHGDNVDGGAVSAIIKDLLIKR